MGTDDEAEIIRNRLAQERADIQAAHIARLERENVSLKERNSLLVAGLINLRLFSLAFDHPGQKIITHFLQRAGYDG